MKNINFFAGPSLIDNSIIKKAIELISNDKKLSLLEISHRSTKIMDLFDETKELIRSLMKLENNKEILFLHGGASLQFAMIPYNIKNNGMAGFINTGIWTEKAIKEANKIRTTNIIASSKSDEFNHIPINYTIDDELAYLHIATNNTIYGTQYNDFIKNNTVPLVADMSSDILSRNIDFNQFDLIFAGFQKNLGTAGGSLVILDKEILETENNLPSMLDYKVHIKGNSMLNTPPVFAVLMNNLSLKWIIEQGGLETIENNNKLKAKLLYDEIDRNSLFSNTISTKDRSLMNICFDALDNKTENRFIEKCIEKNIVGIKGHRVKGGFRASLYNSQAIENCNYLVETMKEFEQNY